MPEYVIEGDKIQNTGDRRWACCPRSRRSAVGIAGGVGDDGVRLRFLWKRSIPLNEFRHSFRLIIHHVMHTSLNSSSGNQAPASKNGEALDEDNVPLFLAAGDGSLFAKLIPNMAENLRANGCWLVETGQMKCSYADLCN
jgi:hypothetical protein